MLDRYLETSIQNKLQFFYLLRAQTQVSTKEIKDLLQTSLANVMSFLNELSDHLYGLAEITIQDSYIFFSVYENVSFLELLHAIYSDSNILHCLHFLITNTDELPFSAFMEQYFLSKSSAYRIRENCIHYLHHVGLDIHHNQIAGEEYRIRFLIALLYYKYGLDCCGIDEASTSLARTFILSTNQAIDRNFLDHSVEEYGFFECLLILTWKRKDHSSPVPPSEDLDQLKDLFTYRKIKKCFQNVVEKELSTDFSDDDYDYLFLAYCCTNNCVPTDKWTFDDIRQVHDIVFSQPAFSDLLHRLGKKFGNRIMNCRQLKATLIYFYKKCLMELQCLIPNKHFYLQCTNSDLLLAIKDCLADILEDWKQTQHIQYEIDPGHILYLSTQLGAVLCQLINPIPLLIVSDIISEIESIHLLLSRVFSPVRVTIIPFCLNAQPLSLLRSHKNSIILVYKKFDHLISEIGIPDSNVILPVTTEMTSSDIESIRKAVLHHEISESFRLLKLSEAEQNEQDCFEFPNSLNP